MRELIINGLAIEITKKKVTVFDPLDDVSTEEVLKIVNYLYMEGFIDNKNVSCEIIKKRK